MLSAATRLAAWTAGGIAAAYGIAALDLGVAGTLLAGWSAGTLVTLATIVWRGRRIGEAPRLGLLWDDREAAPPRPE